VAASAGGASEEERVVEHGARSSIRSVGAVVALAPPALVILLSLIVWVIAVSRSGFWADDFLNLTHFARSLGDLSNDHINTGKYVINVFWAIGTYAFGSGSVAPFLILNTLVFGAGVVMWLRGGTKGAWRAIDAWWIGGLFVATAAWLPTALWSSDITHSAGYLTLGLALTCHNRCMTARSARGGVLWALASGVAWTLAVVSNLIYIGLLAIAAYCAFRQFVRLRGCGMSAIKSVATVGSWSLLLPVVYFVAIAYPATTSSAAYTSTGLQFIHENVNYYRSFLAPTTLLAALYVGVLVVAIAGGVLAATRREWFPLAVLAAAVATALPPLVQSEQRAVNYLAMPLLLLFSAAVAGARPLLRAQSRHLIWTKRPLCLAAGATLVFLFAQGADLRSYFVESPYGDSLAAFRSQVASLTPAGGTICATLDVDAPQRALFVAAMSGEDGFLVPPVSATQAYLVAAGEPCPAQISSTEITVAVNGRGEFVAAAPGLGSKAVTRPAVSTPVTGSIDAVPNPAPTGRTTIAWRSTSPLAVVRVVEDGQAEKLFAAAGSGTQGASFIVRGHVYRFTIYASAQSHTPIASTIVRP
jgi:hypothetical protein